MVERLAGDPVAAATALAEAEAIADEWGAGPHSGLRRSLVKARTPPAK